MSEFKGKIFQIGEVTTGESQRGKWKKSHFVIITDERYNKKLAITVFADLVDQVHENFLIGDEVTLKADVTSREHDGKWYTDVQAWKILGPERKTASTTTSEQAGSGGYNDINDDLPF